jgi:hypothetical protein
VGIPICKKGSKQKILTEAFSASQDIYHKRPCIASAQTRCCKQPSRTCTSMSDKQRLVLSIIDFLNQSVQDGTVKQDDQESLEVASESVACGLQA